MVSDSSGFTGPYVCSPVFMDLWISTIITRIVVWIVPYETLWTRTPEDFITITKRSQNTSMVILIIFIPWTSLQYFFNERGNIWTISETGQSAEFMEYSRYFQDLPSQGTQAMLSQETKKVWTLHPKPSQAKPSLRSSLRSSTGKVQQCSLTQQLHNHTSCTCAALQQQKSSGSAAAVGRLRSISLVCVLHKTITLHLTAVKSRSTVKEYCQK